MESVVVVVLSKIVRQKIDDVVVANRWKTSKLKQIVWLNLIHFSFRPLFVDNKNDDVNNDDDDDDGGDLDDDAILDFLFVVVVLLLVMMVVWW